MAWWRGGWVGGWRRARGVVRNTLRCWGTLSCITAIYTPNHRLTYLLLDEIVHHPTLFDLVDAHEVNALHLDGIHTPAAT